MINEMVHSETNGVNAVTDARGTACGCSPEKDHNAVYLGNFKPVKYLNYLFSFLLMA